MPRKTVRRIRAKKRRMTQRGGNRFFDCIKRLFGFTSETNAAAPLDDETCNKPSAADIADVTPFIKEQSAKLAAQQEQIREELEVELEKYALLAAKANAFTSSLNRFNLHGPTDEELLAELDRMGGGSRRSRKQRGGYEFLKEKINVHDEMTRLQKDRTPVLVAAALKKNNERILALKKEYRALKNTIVMQFPVIKKNFVNQLRLYKNFERLFKPWSLSGPVIIGNFPHLV